MTMADEPVIQVRNLNKTFYFKEDNNDTIKQGIYNLFKNKKSRSLPALSDINFDVNKGEFIGVVGRNGSGKSTLLKLLIGSYKPDKGSDIQINGRIIRLALGMGFDSNLSARDNIYINCSILGLSFKRIKEIFDDIIDFSELHDFVDVPVKHFSSGMKSRLTFSIAMYANADIFLIDEFFGGVGDESFKKKSEKFFKENFLKGKTIIHVSHSLSNLLKFSDKIIFLDKGQIVEIGQPDVVIEKYKASFKDDYLDRVRKEKGLVQYKLK